MIIYEMIPEKIKTSIKKSKGYKAYVSYQKNKEKSFREDYSFSEEYKKAQKMIEESTNMVDLGCGANPHWKAKVAVDKYIEPVHRKFGSNTSIDVDEIEKRGIRFVQADFECLPFADKEFDVAYSHHVIEHLHDPSKACVEMQRIARRGVIMCPSILAEYIFGRQYHKWIITSRDNLLIFIEKDWQGLWFGEGPKVINGKIKASKNCNPFDILLNDGYWYHGIHRYRKLTKMLREYWYGHYKNIETCFVWENKFDYMIIYRDGKIKTSIKEIVF